MGSVAPGKPASERSSSAHRHLSKGLSLSVLTIALLCGTLPIAAESGRRKESGQKNKPPQGPIADPNGPLGVTATTPTAKKDTSAAKSGKADEVEESDVVRISSNLVPIPVSVVDVRGNAVTTLKLEDFELRIDGQPRSISDMTRAETNVHMAMLFDNSGSLDFAREFEKKAAMRFFRRVMRPIDEAAIYSVETESYLAQPLTKDVARLEQTIASFGKPEGGTSLLDAIIDAGSYLRPSSGRRVLVIVSDGIETTSENDFETTMRHVLGDDCQIFVVQTGLYEGANLRALAAERRMEQLSGQTGGAGDLPKTVHELDLAFDQIAADLAKQYVLSFYPGDEPRDGRFHLIDLRVKARNDVRVRSRKGYYAPRPTTAADW